MDLSEEFEHDLQTKRLIHFLRKARSLFDVAAKFDVELLEARIMIDSLEDVGYDIFRGPELVHDDLTFIAVPKESGYESFVKPSKKVWAWSSQPDGQPYGVVRFLDSYKAPKTRIIPIDGVFYGDKAHDTARFDNTILRILKEENTFCFFNGDIITNTHRRERDDKEMCLLKRTSEFLKKIAPISNKILWAQRGCLESKLIDTQGFDPLLYISDRLGIPYFKEPAYIDVLWNKKLFSVWCMHGKSAAAMKGARLNVLRNSGYIHEWTNFLVSGHVGDAMWNRVVKICRDPAAGELASREEFHVTLGNFKKYFGTESSWKGHQPPSTETLVLYLYPDGNHHVKTDPGKGESHD